MRSALVAVVLLLVAGCATGAVDDVARSTPTSERSGVTQQVGGGGGGGGM